MSDGYEYLISIKFKDKRNLTSNQGADILSKLDMIVFEFFDDVKKYSSSISSVNLICSCNEIKNGVFREIFKYAMFDGKELTEEQIEFFDKIHGKVKEIIEDLPAKY